ncbi:hypothetical protein CHS0354_034792 [Potamilus streckersoni]|uniref:N-acetylneuraminate lyase n=1 Tax=Potamilus streckersoni TaxID=2493646 RepID=A0AAE0RSV8_9BIVA|nr:hypothetical protein CHS0354_034792 [Potamilus streckersoni]
MSKISTFKLEGLVAATFTPFDEDGNIAFSKFEDYCEHLVRNDVNQVYVNGTTGEGMSLTLEERKQVVEKWIEIGKNRLKKIVVQVGALNLHDSLEMVHHAVGAGADAIATVPSLFFRPTSIDSLVEYCKKIAAAAPELPFYYYHLPSVTGVELNMEDFMRAAVHEIPSLVGIKFSSKDLVDMIGILNIPAPHRADGKLNVVFGCDEQLMAAMTLGADGSVGSTCNFMAAVYHRMFGFTSNFNLVEARKEQYRSQQLCRIMYRYGSLWGNNVAALKYLMAMAGPNMGPPRPPMRKATLAEFNQFKSEISDLGFFDWLK